MSAHEAMAEATRAAGQAWREAAREVVQALAAEGGPFTTDDVWELMDYRGQKVDDGRAIGTVIRNAKAAGVIHDTGMRQRTKRTVGHGRPISIYAPGPQPENDQSWYELEHRNGAQSGRWVHHSRWTTWEEAASRGRMIRTDTVSVRVVCVQRKVYEL